MPIPNVLVYISEPTVYELNHVKHDWYEKVRNDYQHA